MSSTAALQWSADKHKVKEDKYATWREDPHVTRQEYATFYVQSAQRRFGNSLTFAQLLDSLRFAGEQWDAWQADCRRFAEHQRKRASA